MYHSLIEHINRYTRLSEEDVCALTSLLITKKLKKKEFLLKEGQVCHANYFVMEGCIRMYFTHENGAEQIVNFGIENWWLTDYISLETRQPSRLYIQAIEPSLIIVLDNTTSEELFSRIPALNLYFRKVLQRAYGASQQNLLYIYSLSGEERYRHFSEAYPGFVQRIPQYMVASFLGFTPEFISKIRGKKK